MTIWELFATLVIKTVHIMVIVFVVVTPFVKKKSVLLDVLHLTTVVTLLFHWYVNDDTCFLTYLESAISGTAVNESFIYQIVSPVYKIPDADIRQIAFFVTPFLGVVSFVNVVRNWDSIKRDLSVLFRKPQKSAPIVND